MRRKIITSLLKLSPEMILIGKQQPATQQELTEALGNLKERIRQEMNDMPDEPENHVCLSVAFVLIRGLVLPEDVKDAMLSVVADDPRIH